MILLSLKCHLKIWLIYEIICDVFQDVPNKVTVTDTSKVGVHVNNSKIESKKEIEISSSDIISFGKVFKLK